jgi:mitotic spindle assembly checkpoint protein MAD1
MAHANLERQLVAAQTVKMELETKLREKDILVERLERDRRWFADREKEEREEKDRERGQHEEEKVRLPFYQPPNVAMLRVFVSEKE